MGHKKEETTDIYVQVFALDVAADNQVQFRWEAGDARALLLDAGRVAGRSPLTPGRRRTFKMRCEAAQRKVVPELKGVFCMPQPENVRSLLMICVSGVVTLID